MGCDIHGWIEVNYFGHLKDEKHTAWYPHVDIRMLADRNYRMFAKLFGVRNDYNYKPLFADRGLPEPEEFHEKDWRDKDIEEIGVDGHSYSYCTWPEIKANLPLKFKDKPDYDPVAGSFQMLFNIMEELAKVKGDKNVRLVVWFDN